MSLRAELQVTVHVARFHSIDLLQRGLYQVRIRVGINRSSPICLGEPFDLRATSCSKESLPNPHHMTLPHLQGASYYSSSFLVRHAEEEITIADICFFKIEVPVSMEHFRAPLNVSVRLMFLQSSCNASYELLQGKNIDVKDFTKISSAKLLIRNPFAGTHSYFPVLFSDTHFSALDVVIHTAFTEYIYPSPASTVSDYASVFFPGTRTVTDTEVDMTDRVFFKPLRAGAKALLRTVEALRVQLGESEKELIAQMYSSNISLNLAPKFYQEYHGGRASTRTTIRDRENLSVFLLSEVSLLRPVLFELLSSLFQISQVAPRLCISHFRVKFMEELSELFGECVFRSVSRVRELPLRSKSEGISSHFRLADVYRAGGMSEETATISDVRIVGQMENLPMLFEEAYVDFKRESEAQRGKSEERHLFVLVHGFQSSALDVRLFKNYLSLLRTNCLFLCSVANQERTYDDIRDMGQRLANEIRIFLHENCSDGSFPRISFIAHSLGGLIVRSALQHLSDFSHSMELLATLATPHLGCMYSESKLVDAGLWVLRKWKNSKCISQLCMTDAKDPTETFLYQLAGNSHLHWFRNVVLLSSSQDLYVPFESARIELPARSSDDTRLSKSYESMAKKLLEGVSIASLRRMDVIFDFSDTSLDSVIGRKPHIALLWDQTLIKILLFRYPDLFL